MRPGFVARSHRSGSLNCSVPSSIDKSRSIPRCLRADANGCGIYDRSTTQPSPLCLQLPKPSLKLKVLGLSTHFFDVTLALRDHSVALGLVFVVIAECRVDLG